MSKNTKQASSAHINHIPVLAAKSVIPKIYAYITPGIPYHEGMTKIGYTERDDVHERIGEQVHTVDIRYELKWTSTAVFDNSNRVFTDKKFHAYLRKQGYHQNPRTEWIKIDPKEAKYKLYEFKENQGILKELNEVEEYTLRPEQEEAVSKTVEYYLDDISKHNEFLWNAKPRFGKTLATYDFLKRIDAKKVLIVTNRPAVSSSWYSDYEEFLGRKSGYYFVSDDKNVKDTPLIMDREKFNTFQKDNKHLETKLIEFVSLQNLKGSIYFGGTFNKLESIKQTKWDVLVIDEAHEGVDTRKTDRAFDNIQRKFTLHLSGTPFRALAEGKFSNKAIYNWTYADEQEAKANWKSEVEANPYADLPKLNLFTYKMSDIVENKLKQSKAQNEKVDEYAFDLNEFFETKNGKFLHDNDIDVFLDALTTNEKFPFSTPELRDELRHTFWLLNRIDSAKALYKKLKDHPVFKDYEIVLAAGDGKVDENDERANITSYYKVNNAIHAHEKTITLSVGQLTTGVTIPEWTGVLMLCNMKSPSEYMQAAFRVQNPNLFQYGIEQKRKKNAYVFDFDPARTLNIFEQFANNLSPKTAEGKGTKEEHERHIRVLLNYFPVYGEGTDGKMISLDAKKILRIPRNIRASEVVRSGFRSNYLFANITNIFNAPSTVMEIFDKLKQDDGKKNTKPVPIDRKTIEKVSVDKDGNVIVSENIVIGTAKEILGSKEFKTTSKEISHEIGKAMGQIIHDEIETEIDTNEPIQSVKKMQERVQQAAHSTKEKIYKKVITMAADMAQEKLGKKLQKSETNHLNKDLRKKVEENIQSKVDNFNQTTNILAATTSDALDEAKSEEDEFKIKMQFDTAKMDAVKQLHKEISDMDLLYDEIIEETTRQVETAKIEHDKQKNISDIRDKLRGFSRTIPSFLMAYGDQDILLSNIDTIVPPQVFEEVTSITPEDFRYLRDGGDRKNPKTGEIEHWPGHFFDELVFNDSVTEFIKLKDRLSDYLDENQNEDIFDYIPNQETNQIFTPKRVVKEMVDLLEKENPGCFDDSSKTFADLYMKSGVFITEIIKRLYSSPKIKEEFPNDDERLKHIIEHQVYGMAPTEIIYRIATNYILGFQNGHRKIDVDNSHFVKEDALKAAQEGKLQAVVNEHFG